jgi:GNAT superfamily N-acetyltransferase
VTGRLLARVAEDIPAYLAVDPPAERAPIAVPGAEAVVVDTGGPESMSGTVCAVRATPEAVPSLAAAVDAWFDERGRERATWIVGPSTRPGGAAAQLLDLGAAVVEHSRAMGLEREPERPDADADVREVVTPEDYLRARIVLISAGPGDDPVAMAIALAGDNDRAWARYRAAGTRRLFAAWVDGELVAAGGLNRTTEPAIAVLGGGSTAPHAQGRGLYRALVHRRWEAAREEGAQALAVGASPESAPILARLGFADYGETLLLSRATRGGA